mgnify:CR=1 FL=1
MKGYIEPEDDIRGTASGLVYDKFYSIPNALILINSKNTFLDIVKVGDNSSVYFYRRYPIPKFDKKKYKFTPFGESHQMVLEYYDQKENMFKLEKILFSSPKSTFAEMTSFNCNFEGKINFKFA